VASREQIRQAILDVAGNPLNGVIADLADAFAEAIVRLDSSPAEIRETRVVQPSERR
jgi:hypothetical protein